MIAVTNAARWATNEPPPRKWLVEGLIPAGCVSLLLGDGGLGKSTLMLQLGLAVATGTEWLGMTVSRGPALVIQAEDDDAEIGRRLRRIAAAEDIDLKAAARLETVAADQLGDDVALIRDGWDDRDPTATMAWLKRKIDELKPALLVIDPLLDFFDGDNIDRKQAARFVRLLAKIAEKHGTAIVLIDHPSVSGMASGRGTAGSTGWHAKVRSRLYLHAERDGGLVLGHRKTNYGVLAQPITLVLERGRFVPTKAEASESDSHAAREDVDPAEAVFLALLREETAQGRRLSDKPGSNFAPAVFAKLPDANGFTKKRFETVMRGLLGRGALSVGTGGPPSKPHRVLVLSQVPTPSDPPSNAGGEPSNPYSDDPANDLPAPTIPPSDDVPTPFLPTPHTPLAVGSGLGVETQGRSNARR